MKIVFLFCIKNIFLLFVVGVQRHLHAQQCGREPHPKQNRVPKPKPKQLPKKCKLNIFIFNFHTYRFKHYRKRVKAKELKLQEAVIDTIKCDIGVLKLSPLKSAKNLHINFNSFVHQRSSQVRKLLMDKPSTAVTIMKHVFNQEYKVPRKCYLMNKYWNRNDDGLAKLLLDMGKHRARKDKKKLLNTVNTLKKKYNSLRQACCLADISWGKFHRHTYVN